MCIAVYACNCSTGEAERGRSLRRDFKSACLKQQFPGPSEKLYLKTQNRMDSIPRNDIRGSSLVSTHRCSYTQAHQHPKTKLKKKQNKTKEKNPTTTERENPLKATPHKIKQDLLRMVSMEVG